MSAPLSPGPKYADAWPSERRKSEPDLQLTRAAENRALALAEFVQGEMAEKQGDADRALDAFKRATELDPASASLAVKVAKELARRNEPAEAIRVLKDSIAAAPKEPQTYVFLAQIYAQHLNKPDLAVQTANRAVEAAPEHFSSWAAAHEMFLAAGEKQRAEEFIERALKSTSRNVDFWLQFGAYLRRVFLKEDGQATPDELRQMEAVFKKAVELKPDDSSVLAQAGDFSVLAQKNKEALEFYERAVRLNQPARDEATKNLPEKYIRALAANGRKAEAIPLIERMMRDPNQSTRQGLFDLLCEFYEQSGQPEKAIEHYKRSLLLDTSEPRNHFNLANMQLRAKRAADAVDTMEKARRKFSNRPDVTLGLALALSSAKRHADALKLFEAVAEEAKGRNDDMLGWEFYFKWGAVAEQAGQVDKAAEHLRTSITLNPETPEPYNYLGYMWVDRGQNIEEAGQLIRKAVELSPDNGAYIDSLGWYYFKSGKFEEAKRQLLLAVQKLKEDDATVFDHLGDTLGQLGSDEEAIGYWERALKLNPEAPDKIKAKIEAAREKQGGTK